MNSTLGRKPRLNGRENTHRTPEGGVREGRGKRRQVFGGLLLLFLAGCSMPPAKPEIPEGMVCAQEKGKLECH
jgi:hypothetical protein